MENRKELNLCEILNGHEGEEFYSLMHGNVRFTTISSDGFVLFDYPESISVYPNGKYDENAEVVIYPTRFLYEKYPLYAQKAWQEWVDEQKPWAPKDDEYYWCINDMLNPVSKIFDAEDPEDWARVRANNCFRTQEHAQQAAEAVKKTLEQFHKENPQ